MVEVFIKTVPQKNFFFEEKEFVDKKRPIRELYDFVSVSTNIYDIYDFEGKTLKEIEDCVKQKMEEILKRDRLVESKRVIYYYDSWIDKETLDVLQFKDCQHILYEINENIRIMKKNGHDPENYVCVLRNN